jgi:5-formyltetrahydrofolate cyclo-ligase
METTVAHTKVELRHKMRERLAGLSLPRVRAASEAVEARLVRLPEFARARSFLVYVSRRHEIDTHGLIQRLLARRCRVCVPRFEEATREYAVSELRDFHEELAEGKFRILEPKPDKFRHVRAESLEVFVMPGLAFDKQGNRLGRGKGYFDRLLQHARGTKIALAYDFQVLNEILAEAHDVRLDFIVTETKIIHCK